MSGAAAMNRFGIRAATAILALASGAAWAQERGPRDGTREAWRRPPGWLYAAPVIVPYVDWDPPVYVERYIERVPVYVERVYEEPRERSERSYAQIEPPRAPQAERRARLERYTLSATELFEFDKAMLKMPQPKLDEIAQAMRRNPEIDNVTITGYTDRIGNEAYNLKLSGQRAEAEGPGGADQVPRAEPSRAGRADHRRSAQVNTKGEP